MSRKNEWDQDLWFTAASMEGELKGYLQSVTDNHADTDDLMQLTLARLVPKGSSAKFAEPKRYIWKTARNVGIDWKRQQAGVTEILPIECLDELGWLDGPPNPEDTIAREQEWERVNRIMESLPPRQREGFLALPHRRLLPR